MHQYFWCVSFSYLVQKHGSVRTVQFNLVETSEIQYLLYEDHSERRFKFLMECLHVLIFPKLECLYSIHGMMKDCVFVNKFLSLRSNIHICIIFKAKPCLSFRPIVTFSNLVHVLVKFPSCTASANFGLQDRWMSKPAALTLESMCFWRLSELCLMVKLLLYPQFSDLIT